ncbi:Uncharacterized protein ALO71_01385 [Pseudomonas amygdali pv. dendropanacis]|uniref:PNPLA domain-containing protein n=1 Tax=Pseudomonas amygdali pv. dendropanacis TaxID=235272 RepID=A0A0P9TQI7_PSEA0|nr:patatin-like phospholipase family protein [Pseudomonas amygdali]KPX15621.1 Uncharacterized protein ALO71_01385 [Pseudomonas amygdali pv. dendropanacis]KWS82152.1 hypothetical protein AL051_24520 [Pseudomonas amygdali pv. dendropanacis]
MADEPNVQHNVDEVFLVMQGGGAKGIAHAGGLIAIEDEELSIKGIAGTSAGSIAAVLVAAGYTGRELVDPLKKTHLFMLPPFGKDKGDLRYSKPTQLFTWFGWRVLRALRGLPSLPKRILVPFKATWAVYCWWVLILCLGVGAFFWSSMTVSEMFYAIPATGWRAIRAAAPWLLGVLVFFFFWGLWGITSVRNVRKIIDLILAKRLKERLKRSGIEKSSNITFADMERAGCPPLKIIATNTATESLELFSAERTPDVAVADAVAASICLPIIFKPKRLAFTRRTPFVDLKMKGKFLDGGIVSNLPAWALDEERLLHPGVPTIALSLSSPSPVNKKFWFTALIGTVVNGSSEIHTRTPNKILTVALETRANLLDFDLSASDVYEEVSAAQTRVAEELSMALRGPVVLSDAVRVLQEELHYVMNMFRGSLYRPQGTKDRIRAGIGVQRGSSMKTLSTVFHAGYRQEDPDSQLTVLLRESHAGAAWLNQEVIVDDLGSGEAPRFPIASQAWSERTFILCFPVTEAVRVSESNIEVRARPVVITVDCNLHFLRESPDFDELFQDFCTSISVIATSYTESMDLAQYAQGANTWL